MFIFVVKPLGTCRGWGSSRSVALLSAPPEAQCAAPGGPHPVPPNGAGAEGGPLEGTGDHGGITDTSAEGHKSAEDTKLTAGHQSCCPHDGGMKGWVGEQEAGTGEPPLCLLGEKLIPRQGG
ncbi:unnamed protein product [Pleuronectes platessa]|uniref:Uncharacterized protein n=1 Tax=Pleuronectes platessa TaxID=8262 RepID=A0A9N7VVH9_PLEPL|nr:unnamed protein product [Pleuronectes platessa]